MPDVIQFVDSISASPTVLLDLNNQAPLFVVKGGWSAPPPGQRVSSSSSALADGDLTASSTRTDREITVTVGMDVSTPDAAAAAIQSLARILDAGGQWLKFQPGTTAPVFFRTKRADIEQLEEFNNNAGGYKEATLTIPAEPFAYGLPETGNASGAVFTPAQGSAPSGFTIPSVKGDVVTPVSLAFSNGFTMLASSSTTPAGFPFIVAPAYNELSTGWAFNNAASDAAAFGSATQTWTKSSGSFVFGGTGLLSPTVPAGDYRVVARAKVSGSIGATLRLGLLGQTNVKSFALTDTGYAWIDMGVLRLGAAPPGIDAPPNVAYPTSPVMFYEVNMTAPTGTISIDGFASLPAGIDGDAGSRLMTAAIPSVAGSTVTNVDSDNEVIWRYSSTGGFRQATVGGGFPVAVPGRNCTIVGISTQGLTGITWQYYPKYLYTRPASS